jgi:hypothetical protein
MRPAGEGIVQASGLTSHSRQGREQRARGRPALPWCADPWSGDEMVDGVIPRARGGRPLVLSRPTTTWSWGRENGWSRPRFIG